MRKRNQVACECSAYNFPHRIGGGRCTGSGWCGSYREVIQDDCESCNCFSNGKCQVEAGQEDYKNGDCYEQELRSHILHDNFGNLPLSVDDMMEKLHERHTDVCIP